MKKHILLIALSSGLPALAQLPPGDGPNPVSTVALEPTPVKFDEALLARLQLPPGFKVNVFAKNLQHARWMNVGPNGDIYLSRPKQGDVLLLRDGNGDGVADFQKIVAQNVKNVHGLARRGQQLFMATDKKVLVADIAADGSLSSPRVLVDDLPDGSQHPYRTLAFGADDMLYVTVGSQCNNCVETNPEAATVLRMRPDGSARTVYARGLRNTLGFAFNPVGGQLYGFDHGSDDRGDDIPPEELNAILPNKHYGWPFCWGDRQVDAKQQNDPENSTKADFCPTTEAPVLSYTAHSAPIGLVFYQGRQFPPDYRNSAFVAMRGSWNRGQPSGFKVVRVRFDAGGKPLGIEDFATGWLMATPPAQLMQPGAGPTAEQMKAGRPAQFGRLSGLAVAADGALLVAEDQNGVIYRITYPGR
ncbi:PQQ-dependent sugar dehydrogenase [Variovorax sp. J22P271]|uniref:PQQ-dependent sugar dehydrogenase n=1 Tax=Variovorax davisae TaxID=3053515 RepID=UPI002574FBFB|nr:PQQ-dependent sugar dehydrogenase [Variovorax sp. J22P271]MDM0032260.1 PQQ-dependent sugar dehydrogenase [Variovorax sp. J22P271]